MSDFLLRVGAAIVRAQGDDPVHSDPEGLKHMARAAISAMREPTDEMAQVIWDKTGHPCWKENAIEAWQAGIDVALGVRPT